LQKNSTWELESISGVEPTRFKACLGQLDVKTTFLHGDLDEEIYMTQAQCFFAPGQEHLVFHLKSLYEQAPRKFLNGSFGYLLLYIDDMLIASHDNAVANLISDLAHALKGTSHFGLLFVEGFRRSILGYVFFHYAVL
ncbi:hypothetical protein ACJX0J_011209, partial [Zea mays]